MLDEVSNSVSEIFSAVGETTGRIVRQQGTKTLRWETGSGTQLGREQLCLADMWKEVEILQAAQVLVSSKKISAEAFPTLDCQI